MSLHADCLIDLNRELERFNTHVEGLIISTRDQLARSLAQIKDSRALLSEDRRLRDNESFLGPDERL